MKINKIVIFTGPKSEFLKIIPAEYMSLTELAMTLDNEKKVLKVEISGQKKTKPEELTIDNLVIDTDEYAGVSCHVITNFCNFISRINVKEIYIQNPPETMKAQISKLGSICEDIATVEHKYPSLTKKDLITVLKNFDSNIIGQQSVKDDLLISLLSLIKQKTNKPLVLLFYGNSGVGKTETAKYLSNVLETRLFRKQFSMLQNNQSFAYVYGGTYSEPSLAKDLLDRESNIILFDEFDKAYSAFHNAFYEMFDEGVFRDLNYSVNLENAIIICTSNYLSVEDIEKNLGIPITSRFDHKIKFDDLSEEAKEKIIDKVFSVEFDELDPTEQSVIEKEGIKKRLLDNASKFKSARTIKKVVRDVMYTTLLPYILSK